MIRTIPFVVAAIGVVGPPCSARSTGPTRATPDPWRWNEPLAPAIASAGKGQRLLLLLLDRSPNSARLRQAEWARPPLSSAASGMLLLGYDAQAGEGNHVARRYNVVLYPSLVLIDGNATEIGRISGAYRRDGLAAELFDLQRGDSALQRMERLWGDMPNDLPLTLWLGREFALRGQYERAMFFLDHVSVLDQGNSRGAASQALLIECDLLLQRSLEDTAAAQSCIRQLERRYPRSGELIRSNRARSNRARSNRGGLRLSDPNISNGPHE